MHALEGLVNSLLVDLKKEQYSLDIQFNSLSDSGVGASRVAAMGPPV